MIEPGAGEQNRPLQQALAYPTSPAGAFVLSGDFQRAAFSNNMVQQNI